MSDEQEIEVCEGCGAAKPSAGWHYEDDPLAGPTGTLYVRLCEACAVAQWECPVRFKFHLRIPKEIRDRLVNFAMLQRLKQWFYDGGRRPTTVQIYHRRESETLPWMMEFDRYRRNARATEPYSYRGFCSHDYIVLLYDETETADSMEWLLYHELGHHVCNQAKMFDQAMEKENKNEGRTTYEWKDDVGHEADSEERLVNRIANAYMGGREYARPWWRPRVTALLAGDMVLPDGYAEAGPEWDAFVRLKHPPALPRVVLPAVGAPDTPVPAAGVEVGEGQE